MQIFLIIVFLGLITTVSLRGKIMNHSDIIKIYFDKAKKFGDAFGVDTSLILAVIKQESGGKFDAVGSTGDYGLMQITQPALTDFNRSTGNHYSLFNMQYDINKNIQVGTWYLNWVSRFLNTKNNSTILTGYNAGVGNLESTAGKAYAQSVLNHQIKIINILQK